MIHLRVTEATGMGFGHVRLFWLLKMFLHFDVSTSSSCLADAVNVG